MADEDEVMDELTREHVARARAQYEALADATDEELARKLAILTGLAPTASQRALRRMNELHTSHVLRAISGPRQGERASAAERGEVIGLARAVRILTEECNIEEPVWVGTELDA